MCPPAAHWSIIQSINYISKKKIPGDFVECGVFKGGNLILMNHLRNRFNLNNKIFAFDTFEGMSEPTIYYKQRNEKWCYGGLEEVKKNINLFDNNYVQNFNFIKGKVEDTLKINDNLPQKISLLRLDTDFYESTKIEMEILFPRLVKGGILIVDDYGHWKGSQKAVDEYLDLKNNFHFLHRVDYGTRLLIKDY